MKRSLMVALLGACSPSTSTAAATISPQNSAARSDEDYLSPAFPPGDHESCPADSPWSCSAGSSDSCCYEGNNGIFLQTQFWDYNPATGPAEAWTLHGLWSDRCGGGFRQFCNRDWAIDSAEQTLRDLGMDSLVETMSTYWKNQYKDDNELWTHEFNKHGTCMSTVSPSCYDSSQPQHQNVGDFFNRTVGLYEELTTFDWLASAGISPSEDKTWGVAEVSAALAKHADGRTVYLGCDRNNALNEVWYFFSLKGSVADGEFKFIDSVSTSTCTDGFKYLPKGSSGGSPGDGGGEGGDYQRGNINVTPQGQSKQGCLISDGSWYSSGTCATFKFKKTIGGVQVSSSKGPCGIVGGSFKCSKKTQGSDFQIQNKKLTYDGSSEWSAEQVPGHSERTSVFPDTKSQITIELDTTVSF